MFNEKTFVEKEYCIIQFSSIDELVDLVKQKNSPLIILYSIAPNNIDSFQNLSLLSACNPQPIIILLISSLSDAVKGYEYNVFRCVLRTDISGDLISCLDSAVRKSVTSDRTLLLSCKTGLTILKLNQLLYAQKSERKIIIYTTLSNPIIRHGALKDLYLELDDKRFCVIDKNCFVNIDHVIALEENNVLLENGIKLPVSRRMKPVLLSAIKSRL